MLGAACGTDSRTASVDDGGGTFAVEVQEGVDDGGGTFAVEVQEGVDDGGGTFAVEVQEGVDDGGGTFAVEVQEGVDDGRLGNRFPWCGAVQDEWNAVEHTLQTYRSSVAAAVEADIRAAGMTDELDLAEANIQTTAALDLQQRAREDFDRAIQTMANRLYRAAWRSVDNATNNGIVDMPFVQWWHGHIGKPDLIETYDQTLEIAYERAWGALIDVGPNSEISVRFSVLVYLSYLSEEYHRLLEHVLNGLPSFEVARDEYYTDDEFADLIRSDYEEYQVVDGHLYDVYLAVRDYTDIVSDFQMAIDGLESTIKAHASEFMSDAAIDDLTHRIIYLDELPRGLEIDLYAIIATLEAAIDEYRQLESYSQLSKAAQGKVILAFEAVFESLVATHVSMLREHSGFAIDVMGDFVEDGARWLVPLDAELEATYERGFEYWNGRDDLDERHIGRQPFYVGVKDTVHRHAQVRVPGSREVVGIDYESLSDTRNEFAAFMNSLRESCASQP